MRKFIVVCLAAVVVSGCAITKSDVDYRAVTADEVGVSASKVKILSSEGGRINPFKSVLFGGGGRVQGYKWTADTPKGIYLCEGDVNLTRVICDKQK